MFWADKVAAEIRERYAQKTAAGGPLITRDEKTASGRVHVGSMRGVAVHGVVSEVLSEAGVANTYLYEINDFDVMDSVPAYLPKEFEQYVGQLLYTVPSPTKGAENYAEHFAGEFMDVINETGFYPEFYRSSELYKSGRMNEAIRRALEHVDIIRDIYARVSNSRKPAEWHPLSVVCEQCGKIGTTIVTGFDGERVMYTCKPDLVKWAEGCGHTGMVSPFDGNAKLPWKVEWPAKFFVLGVDIEGAGKDHSTKGGARDVADHIAREVYGYEPPYNIPYEFFLVEGKKMASSKGRGASARDIANLVPPEIFRMALIGKQPNRQTNFDPSGDTIPVLFDAYDKIAEKYFAGEKDDDARLFELAHVPEDRPTLEDHFRPRFSQVAFLVQMPHMDVEEEVAKMKGGALTDVEKQEVAYRIEYAGRWLDTCAPEDYKYTLQTKEVPQASQRLSPAQKEALAETLRYIESSETLDGQELHTALHDIRKELGIDPKEFFSALYLSFLGKGSGPKAGWFLSVLDRDFLIERLRAVSGSPG